MSTAIGTFNGYAVVFANGRVYILYPTGRDFIGYATDLDDAISLLKGLRKAEGVK